ncbi:hypothetical protein D1AOALGA4SA_4656 [Olavius algarvensis Delta 1 endosymbiont]|nr:hypothetical protein D1AOALGA4SA_4656 [Olavius algarvensis Delta 1 endosymbiont]
MATTTNNVQVAPLTLRFRRDRRQVSGVSCQRGLWPEKRPV